MGGDRGGSSGGQQQSTIPVSYHQAHSSSIITSTTLQGSKGRYREQSGAVDHQPDPDERPVPQILRQVSVFVIIRKTKTNNLKDKDIRAQNVFCQRSREPFVVLM